MRLLTRKLRYIFILLSLVFYFVASSAICEEYIYRKSKGDQVSSFRITINRGEDSSFIQYSVSDKIEKNNYLCHDNFDLISWEYSRSDNGTHFMSKKKQGNVIIFEGKLEGKQIKREVEIDDSPWFQDILVPISYLAKNNLDKSTFWFVDVDGLKAYKLVASRDKVERITINDSSFRAVKYCISLSNIPSFFWSLDIWFRLEDSLFVKLYGAISGPFASKTLIELVERQ